MPVADPKIRTGALIRRLKAFGISEEAARRRDNPKRWPRETAPRERRSRSGRLLPTSCVFGIEAILSAYGMSPLSYLGVRRPQAENTEFCRNNGRQRMRTVAERERGEDRERERVPGRETCRNIGSWTGLWQWKSSVECGAGGGATRIG